MMHQEYARTRSNILQKEDSDFKDVQVVVFLCYGYIFHFVLFGGGMWSYILLRVIWGGSADQQYLVWMQLGLPRTFSNILCSQAFQGSQKL